MDKHDHARHIGEGCVESVAWRTSFIIFCQGDADGDGDDGAFICCSFHGQI